MLSRLPIRVRVAAAFALAMAAVLAASGAFVYAKLGADLAHALDQDLRLRAQDLRALAREPGDSLAADSSAHLVEAGESFAQLLAPGGRVLDSTASVRGAPLLPASALADARGGPAFFDRDSVRGLNEPARLLATPVTRAGGERAVLVVGATRENRAEALRSLRTELLIAGPLALVVATALGYLLAGSGLRAVDAMRRRAAHISAARPGERLPVPRTRDELERLGETLNDMLDRLEDALERERGFVADAGHELRTPLALLRAELDFALQHADSEQELREALRTASEETDRLSQLAADLLLIAGAERGGLPLRIERIGVGELLESVRNRFAWRAGDAGRDLVADAPAGLALDGDRLRLEQALGNLVENALRHGGGEIELHARRAGDRVELRVCDRGPGFRADFIPQAFQRFSRGDESHGGAGAGLGLSIVDAVAQAHGGASGARNRDGGGAEVWLAVPAAVSESAATAAPPRQRSRP